MRQATEITLIFGIMLLVALVAAAASSGPQESHTTSTPEKIVESTTETPEERRTLDEWAGLEVPDPFPVCAEPTVPEFPSKDQLRLIGRMADGIWKWKTARGNRPYYFCGLPYVGEEARELSSKVAFHIVNATWDREKQKMRTNPWGVFGTMANESAFDLCAFGLHPRQAAYRLTSKSGKPILKSSKLTISHTYKDVVKALADPKLQANFRAFDLGLLQTLDIYYLADCKDARVEGSREDLLTWEGFYWQVKHMADRERWHSTDRPWAYWPGRHSPQYDKKVTSHARRMGATAEEI